MVEVNVIVGAGMDSLVVDAVEVNDSLVSDFAVNNIIMQLWKYLYGCYDRGCAHNMQMLRANRGGGCG